MYGWRARIGFLTPSDVLETPAYEFYRMAPAGIALVASCLNINQITAEAIDKACSLVETVARGVAAYAIDYLIIGGAPLGYLHGPGTDRVLAERVSAACGVPALCDITASIEALRKLDIRRLAIASPLGEAINRRLADFLKAAGFEVLAVEGLGKGSNAEITMLPTHASYQVALAARRKAPDADGLYITCARWPVAPNLELLEQDLGIPVVASMQAALWAPLHYLGLRAPIAGYGRLLREI